MDGSLDDGGLIHYPPLGRGLGKGKIWAMEIKCKTSSTARAFWNEKWLSFRWKGRKDLRSSLLEGGSGEQRK